MDAHRALKAEIFPTLFKVLTIAKNLKKKENRGERTRVGSDVYLLCSLLLRVFNCGAVYCLVEIDVLLRVFIGRILRCYPAVHRMATSPNFESRLSKVS